ncbi:thiol peroxidase [Campylobacter pinnipediorum]|uniref:thiol peroxidase n=1 Tax=Campylobacter pinnipediorum TaxID=1965231 RepID=UPI00084DDB87|nr:thiol peroxidase [Campylobacter pinnipediorum]
MTKFQGNPVKLFGTQPKVGDKAPVVEVVGKDLNTIKIGEAGKTQVVVVVPSLDTPVCASEARKFNEKAASKTGVEVVVASMDLPFAMGRFCTTEGIENVQVGSDFRGAEFGKAYGVLIEDSVLKGLLARAIFVLKDGKVAYTQIVPEVTEEPDYEAVFAAL